MRDDLKSFSKIWSPNTVHTFMVPEYIMLHYTGGNDYMWAVRWFNNPAAKVSAHFVIGIDGDVVQMVRMDEVAWHAGEGNYKGITDMNSCSIGIELANDGKLPYSKKQIEALNEMLDFIKNKFKIKEIIGHSDYTTRKVDPGNHFPWDKIGVIR